MEPELDPRLIRISFEIDGFRRSYGGNPEETGNDELAISVQGTKFSNPIQGECTIQITNLTREIRDFLLTEGSPYMNQNRNQREIRVEVGRVSTGLSLLYVGGIFRTSVTQPPDQTVTIQCKTKQFQKTDIVTNSFSGNVPLSQIAEQVATDLNTELEFRATDTMIANYSFSGSTTKQVDKLDAVIGISAFVDDEALVVIDEPRETAAQARFLTPMTGLVGIPVPTEQGIKVTMLYDQQTINGGLIDLQSVRYATYNGTYRIYKLSYHITNRDTPFYLIAECQRFAP